MSLGSSSTPAAAATLARPASPASMAITLVSFFMRLLPFARLDVSSVDAVDVLRASGASRRGPPTLCLKSDYAELSSAFHFIIRKDPFHAIEQQRRRSLFLRRCEGAQAERVAPSASLSRPSMATFPA